VGGDFYDAFPTPRGWMVVVGDVAGQGARAAALTGLARFTLRTAGQLTGDPEITAIQLNRTLREQPEMSLCTAAILLVHPDRAGAGLALTVLALGHPLPVLVRGGVPSTCGRPGALAGAFDDVAWTPETTALREGDALLVYTDGVLDTDGAGGRFGDDRLMAILHGAPRDPAALVALVDDALQAFQRGPQRDDTAMVALGVDDVAAALADMPEVPRDRVAD
jgi:serine phosphatase RsbU (regulator of sigma subunit)